MRGMFGDDTVLLIAPFQGLELNDNKYQYRWAIPIAEVLSPFRAKTLEAIFNYCTSQLVLTSQITTLPELHFLKRSKNKIYPA